MPEIIDEYRNITSYMSNTYISDWIKSDAISTYTITSYINNNYDLDIEFTTDEYNNVIETNAYAGLNGYNSVHLKVEYRYFRIHIKNIAVLPSILQLQILFTN